MSQAIAERRWAAEGPGMGHPRSQGLQRPSSPNSPSAAPSAALPSAQQSWVEREVSMSFEQGQAQRVATNASTLEQVVDELLESGGADPSVASPQARATDSEPSRVVDHRKAVPPPTHGFLVQCMEYAMHRIPTCNAFCVVCDKLHMFAGDKMLKPAVCTRDLCVYAFQTLRVGSDATEEGIATDSGVVDLLVCMIKAAAESTRARDILQPFPHVVDPQHPDRLALDPSAPDFGKLCGILQSFPLVRDLNNSSDVAEMHRMLGNGVSYQLLQWIIQSNRSHIVKLKPEQHLTSMGTPHQYLLVTAAPEKQKLFDALKEKHGSKFAFHGSPIENWHCILREGLRNHSGTSLQLHGAAYGRGVYLASSAGVSFGYCGSNRGLMAKGMGPGKGKGTGKGAGPAQAEGGPDASTWINGGNGMYCIALCETINLELSDHGFCWVQPKPEQVVTRFLFVYDRPTPMNWSDTMQPEFQQEILHALNFRSNSQCH
mmetsp:Transcript_35822/g.63974  ORF Transcript_35822/g.63974 Transcript_35822/m.63974 type:complete len:487 (-) Transcript_35822:1664-3124(-)